MEVFLLRRASELLFWGQDFLDADIVNQRSATNVFQVRAFLIIGNMRTHSLCHGKHHGLIGHAQPI